jgi:hypothetical protein
MQSQFPATLFEHRRHRTEVNIEIKIPSLFLPHHGPRTWSQPRRMASSLTPRLARARNRRRLSKPAGAAGSYRTSPAHSRHPRWSWRSIMLPCSYTIPLLQSLRGARDDHLPCSPRLSRGRDRQPWRDTWTAKDQSEPSWKQGQDWR